MNSPLTRAPRTHRPFAICYLLSAICNRLPPFARRPLNPRFLVPLALLVASHLAAATLTVQELRCAYLRDPLGIDTPQPRLSWVLQSGKRTARDQGQSAYQILVSSTARNLQADKGDLWDSGKTTSSQSIQVAYAGVPLRSRQECFWKVRVWDQDGRPSPWSEPARWTMGLLDPGDWQAKWIGLDQPEPQSTLTNTSWIWFPEGHADQSAPVATRYFRRVFDLPAGRTLQSARWLVTADNQFTAFVNGQQAGAGNNFKAASDLDVLHLLHTGKNLLAASAKNSGDAPNPAGFVALLEIKFTDGPPLLLPTDHSWQSSAEKLDGWLTPAYDDSTWLPARDLGPVGMKPWGEVAGPEDRRLPARWLRKEFSLDRKVRRATACFAGLGLSELYVNGQKVSDDVLSPALSDYTKRVFYVTRDVTPLLRKGHNALGVVLGNGRFFAPRIRVPTDTVSYGSPKLLLQLEIAFADGSRSTVISDDSWRLTTNGPIRANNEYDGE